MNLADDAETEDEIITNGKDLYKRFENLVSKDHINIGSHKDHASKVASSNLRNQRD